MTTEETKQNIESESTSPTSAVILVSSEKPKDKMDENLLSNQDTNGNPIEYTLNKKGHSRLKPKHFVYLCTSLACLSSILLGYDIG